MLLCSKSVSEEAMARGEGEGYVRELFQDVGVVIERGSRKQGAGGWWMVVLL
jgi:hypothetical protein